ncbi:unnamed protein product [Caenorhabditis bovis]|uniref:Dimethylglycine dehydrogenase n=1 Tax=Caenorhabditis bovis TaxID=2654633 RepID=A0A8S1F5T8_9PELO|nr:unnamed protein product [Caenorhabditis bovis]
MLRVSQSVVRIRNENLNLIRNSSTKHVFACVLGSGVAGSSVAYHLVKRNIKDILLLERASGVASPSGTSFHSPGLVAASHPAHRYKPILAHSVDLYSKLEQETGVKIDFKQTGTLRLATNEARLAEFRKYVSRDYYKEGDVCKTTLLTPDQVRELSPALDHSKILGALHTTNDGSISARGLTQAFVAGAKAGGAQVIDGAIPKHIFYDKEKGHWTILLEDGTTVYTRNLVNAGGIWANDIARLSGYKLPVVVVEHQYAVITPGSSPSETPSIIDHDSAFYVRKSGDEYLFGAFENSEKTVIREDWYKNGVPTGGSQTVKQDFSRVEDSFKRACELIPDLQGAKVDARAAVFSMTPDGYPLVGPYDKNYWMSTGFLDGVSSGGGIGKYLADWIVDGEPPAELFDTDASRYDRWGDRKLFTDRSRETYSTYYNWSYTDRLAGRPTDRISGIYGRLKRDGANFLFRNGWEVANSFPIPGQEDEGYLPTLIREYEMVTNKCGLIDLSWKGKIEVKGKDAEKLMDYALASKIPPLGKISSGVMLTRRGNILAPLMVFHHDRHRSAFILLTEPERESRDLYWLRRAAAEQQLDVQVSLVSEYLASLALVGPKSREVLSALTKSDVSDEGFPQKSTRMIRLGPVGVVCARSSTSTGQLSYELFHNRAETHKLYNAMMTAGKEHGIVNFGQAALNMMRLEHGYKIWARELTLDTNPFECGLGSLVDFNKKEFIGRSSALELSKKEFKRRLALITFDVENGQSVDVKHIPIGNEVIRRDGEEKRVGQITSGAYNVRVQKPIAFAWLDKSVEPNERLVVDVGDARLIAASIETPTIPPIQ